MRNRYLFFILIFSNALLFAFFHYYDHLPQSFKTAGALFIAISSIIFGNFYTKRFLEIVFTFSDSKVTVYSIFLTAASIPIIIPAVLFYDSYRRRMEESSEDGEAKKVKLSFYLAPYLMLIMILPFIFSQISEFVFKKNESLILRYSSPLTTQLLTMSTNTSAIKDARKNNPYNFMQFLDNYTSMKNYGATFVALAISIEGSRIMQKYEKGSPSGVLELCSTIRYIDRNFISSNAWHYQVPTFDFTFSLVPLIFFLSEQDMIKTVKDRSQKFLGLCPKN